MDDTSINSGSVSERSERARRHSKILFTVPTKEAW